jgi:DNA-binding response OmpR family regulator
MSMIPVSARAKVPTANVKFRGRVLIIDDEPLVRWSLCSGLGTAGFDAVTASSSEEALTLARECPVPDVILLDVDLYDSDPHALVSELRRLAPHCRLLVLATAGREISLLRWTDVVILEKPFDLPEVVRLVDATADACRSARTSSVIARSRAE